MATVYRFYSPEGALLYVGCTLRLPARISHHSRMSPWFLLATNVTLQHFATWGEAASVEKQAILDEQPRYNIDGARAAERLAAMEARRAIAKPAWLTLTTARESAALSKAELARRCGISQALVTRLENGERNATSAVLQRLATALQTSSTALLGSEFVVRVTTLNADDYRAAVDATRAGQRRNSPGPELVA